MTLSLSLAKTFQAAREKLYRRFRAKLVTNQQLDRTLVSFQANRKLAYYRWLRYKEGFSARFVEYAIKELTSSPGVLLDPFAGTGASLFAARQLGWDTMGIELLPVGSFAIEARLAAQRVDPQEFRREIDKAAKIKWETLCSPRWKLKHVPITEGAFPEHTESAIAGYRAYCSRVKDHYVRTLFELACLSVLEAISYTRKDGQYLRWDRRAKKTRSSATFDKGPILEFGSAVFQKLHQISEDICAGEWMQEALFDARTSRLGCLDLRQGSCLDILPDLSDDSVDMVITSPPYCNRYDYTRTYALELIYLGASEEDIKTLRQRLLSCTVENRTKIDQLRSSYASRNREPLFGTVVDVFEHQEALQEALSILDGYGSAGQLNNSNIPCMVKNYFLEMAFVICELARIVRPHGTVVMVNDNVRYAGEEIPVDLILSDFAERFGMEAKQIWTLSRGKGNSSQQMGLHGRSELRKCVYVWRRK
jgi:DNA modification methylase